ncbi:hypothetical protein PFISCL1PPCAC_17229, partial [Pristionchus fissidentatus]
SSSPHSCHSSHSHAVANRSFSPIYRFIDRFPAQNMEFEEVAAADVTTAEKIGFEDLDGQVDLLEQLISEWNLDRPPMYRLEDNLSMLTTVAPLTESDTTTVAEGAQTARTPCNSARVARTRQTRSIYVIDEEPAVTGRHQVAGTESAETGSMYVMDKNEPLVTFEMVGEAKSEYYWQEPAHYTSAAPLTSAAPARVQDDKIPFTARNVTSANVAPSALDQNSVIGRDQLFSLLMTYQQLSQTNVQLQQQ